MMVLGAWTLDGPIPAHDRPAVANCALNLAGAGEHAGEYLAEHLEQEGHVADVPRRGVARHDEVRRLDA